MYLLTSSVHACNKVMRAMMQDERCVEREHCE